MASDRFVDSPVRLRPHSTGVFEARSGDRVVELDLEHEPRKPPDKKEGEEEIVRTGNPEPTVDALLMLGDDVVAKHRGKPVSLKPSDADELSTWIENQGPADKLVVDVSADHVTTKQAKHLARIGSRHGLSVDVNLGHGG